MDFIFKGELMMYLNKMKICLNNGVHYEGMLRGEIIQFNIFIGYYMGLSVIQMLYINAIHIRYLLLINFRNIKYVIKFRKYCFNNYLMSNLL